MSYKFLSSESGPSLGILWIRYCVAAVVLGRKKMAPVVLVFALRQNGRVGSQYPKAQEFEAANATLGWLLGQALKIHLGEGGITPAARDMCHWSTTVQNEEHPAHGFCSSDDRHTSPAKYMSISTVIRWIDFESAWRGWSNSPACADLCHLFGLFWRCTVSSCHLCPRGMKRLPPRWDD